MTGLLELRTYASLFVANLIQCLCQLGYCLVVVHQLFHAHVCLVDLCNHLKHAQVVGLAHKHGYQIVDLIVLLAYVSKQFHGESHLHSLFHFCFVFQSE